MKKKGMVALVLALCSMQSFALVQKCKGYYIGLLNDSVPCTFDILIDRKIKTPIYLELQKKVVCVDDVGGKKHSFSPKKIKRFVFDFDTAKVEMHSLAFGRKNARIFAKREVNGYLCIYDYYTENEARSQQGVTIYGAYGNNYGNGMYSVQTGIYQNFLMQKEGGAIGLIDGLNFKAGMASYFEDAPELAAKIKKGEYTKKMIQQIGMEYNTNRK
jgi:hypothetical protein